MYSAGLWAGRSGF